jgi:hypothetical protein
MPLTPQEELLLLDYQDRLREGDLTDEQRQALRAEIARFTEAAPTPLDLRPQPVDVPSDPSLWMYRLPA